MKGVRPGPVGVQMQQRGKKIEKAVAEETWPVDAPDSSFSSQTPPADVTLPVDIPSSIGDTPRMDDSEPPTHPVAPPGTTLSELHEGGSVPGYKILEQIGRGGMGAVFLAEQQRPQRTVALKVIRPDRVSKAALRRFEYEAQLLARLRHPGIAQVYEVGSFDLGEGKTPYFAMEYIADAKALTDYANEHKLSVRYRLDLFVNVCDAVQHGHQKGIIHRDLKPANILVDSNGSPHIIDFGVARSSDSEIMLATMQTNAGQLIGTLQYMSPEQCSGDSDNVDVRADVYALGVILFQLLSGQLPYDLSTMGLAEALIVVTQQRAVSLAAVHAGFKGDLAIITAKALAKDKTERYQSASELAADIRRYLQDRPILARPIGPIVLLRKWLKRNRELGIALISAAAVLAITSTVLVTRIIIAEQVAQKNLSASRGSVDLVREMLQFRGPDGQSRLEEGKIDVKTLLDDAAQSITRSLPEHPATEAEFRELLGVGYISLRALDDAKLQLTRVLEIREHESPTDPAAIATALHNLARVYYFEGDFHSALDLYSRSLAIRRELHPGDNPDTATSLTHLAATRLKLDQLDEAQNLFEQALAMRQRLYGNRHPDVAASLNNLGNLLVARRRFADAEPYFRRSLEMISALQGEDSLETSYASQNLATCLLGLHNFTDAESLFRRALAIRTALLPPGHVNIESSQLGLATALLELDQLPEAESLARTSLEQMQANLRNDHPELTHAQEVLGRILMAEHRYDDAEPLLHASVQGTRAAVPLSARDLAERLMLLGQCLFQSSRTPEAEQALQESFELASTASFADLVSQSGAALLALYQRSGRTEDAARLSTRLGDAVLNVGDPTPRRP